MIADEKGQMYLNLSGNSGMATAGSGDVLSGILAAVLCMYLKTEEQPPMVLKAALGVIFTDFAVILQPLKKESAVCWQEIS